MLKLCNRFGRAIIEIRSLFIPFLHTSLMMCASVV